MDINGLRSLSTICQRVQITDNNCDIIVRDGPEKVHFVTDGICEVFGNAGCPTVRITDMYYLIKVSEAAVNTYYTIDVQINSRLIDPKDEFGRLKSEELSKQIGLVTAQFTLAPPSGDEI